MPTYIIIFLLYFFMKHKIKIFFQNFELASTFQFGSQTKMGWKQNSQPLDFFGRTIGLGRGQKYCVCMDREVITKLHKKEKGNGVKSSVYPPQW